MKKKQNSLKKFNFRNKYSVDIKFGVISLIFTVAFFIISFSNTIRINNLEYYGKSLDYKPIIKVDSIKPTPICKPHKKTINQNTSVYIDKVKIRYYFKNMGRESAEIINIVQFEYPTFKPILRDSLIYGNYDMVQNKSLNMKLNRTYYILVGMEGSVESVVDIQRQGKVDTLFIHSIITYKNSLDMLYDTYNVDMFIVNKKTYTSNSFNFTIKSTDILQHIDANQSFHIYSKKEKRKFLKNQNRKINKK